MRELLMSLLPSRLGKKAQFSSGRLVTGSKLQSPPLVISLKKKLKYLELNHESEWSWVLCWCSAAWAAAEPKQKGSKMGYALDALDQSNCDPSVCESTKVRLNFLFNYLDQQMLFFRILNFPDTAQKTVSESFWLI